HQPQRTFFIVLDKLTSVFFFQAEDGIRDFHVTGVQTCALPILPPMLPRTPTAPMRNATRMSPTPRRCSDHDATTAVGRTTKSDRSEERRVGKECRCGGTPDHRNE